MQQLLPGFTPPALPPIPLVPQQYQNPNPPRPTLLLAQPIPNPNNRPSKPLHNDEIQMAPTYVIHSAPIQEIQLRSGKTLNKTPPAVIIQEESGEEITEKEIQEEEEVQVALENTQVLGTQSSQSTAQPQLNKNHPYLEMLLIEKHVVCSQFDLENELKNVCIRIPLL